jgi:thiosulfate reductase cytochrome b subunit
MIRLWHWINVVALTLLFGSGLQIFNAHPHLYWGQDADADRQLLAVQAVTTPEGNLRGEFVLGTLSFDTTGILGVSEDANGHLRARGFPSWLTLPSGQWLALGRRWHNFFAWVFALNGLLYLAYGVGSGHLRQRILGWAREPTTATITGTRLRYGLVQRLSYASILLLAFPMVIASGVAMAPMLNAAWPWLPDLFGGRQSARAMHFLLAFGLLGFGVGHVVMVIAKGFFRHFHAMLTGWYYAERG